MAKGYADDIYLSRVLAYPTVISSTMYCSCAATGAQFIGMQFVVSIIASFIYIAICKQLDLSKESSRCSILDDAGELITGWTFTIFVLAALRRILDLDILFDDTTLRLWAISTVFALPAVHLLLRWDPLTRSIDQGVCSTVMIGLNDVSVRITEICKNEHDFGIALKGYFDDRCRNRTPARLNIPLLGSLVDVVPYVKKYAIKKVMISSRLSNEIRIRKLATQLQDTTASIYILQDSHDFLVTEPRVRNLGGLPVVSLCESPILGFNRALKRAFDITLSAVAIILLSPLLLCIAAAVRATSPGPALFRQDRYGLHGEKISVLKFRSMRADKRESSSEPLIQAKRNDSRLTPIGAFLRSSSLDELPQLFNVLRGSMSIVGPRPHAVIHNEEYRQLIRGYMVRHMVKPGITGWAQVNGQRGETSSVEKMESRVRYDLDYLRNWSIWLDLWIVVSTVQVVISRKNAY